MQFAHRSNFTIWGETGGIRIDGRGNRSIVIMLALAKAQAQSENQANKSGLVRRAFVEDSQSDPKSTAKSLGLYYTDPTTIIVAVNQPRHLSSKIRCLMLWLDKFPNT